MSETQSSLQFDHVGYTTVPGMGSELLGISKPGKVLDSSIMLPLFLALMDDSLFSFPAGPSGGCELSMLANDFGIMSSGMEAIQSAVNHSGGSCFHFAQLRSIHSVMLPWIGRHMRGLHKSTEQRCSSVAPLSMNRNWTNLGPVSSEKNVRMCVRSIDKRNPMKATAHSAASDPETAKATPLSNLVGRLRIQPFGEKGLSMTQ